MKPKYPFYAEGTKNYDPHLTAPTERAYRYKYVIGDFQCAALATAENKIVDIKALH